MTENITLVIDGKEISVEQGKTLLDAARENGIDIPTICWHQATKANGLCRLCVVEVEGWRLLQPSCVVQAAKDMKVHTRNERIDRARKTILEMLASTMDLSDAPEIFRMMDEYGASADRFPDAERRESEVKDDNPMYIRDYSKSTSKGADTKRKLAHSSIKQSLKRRACCAVSVWEFVLQVH